MAAFSPPSGNVYGDFLKYIFPGVVAVLLFVPLVSPETTAIDGVLVGAVIVGYLTADLVSEIATKIAKLVWPYRTRYNELREERKYLRENWDFLRIAYAMPKDDREYLEHASRKAEFYKLNSFYLFLYGGANLILWLASGGLMASVTAGQRVAFDPANWAETPMLGRWTCPTWLVIAISVGLGHELFKFYLRDYEFLFGYDGHTERLAATLYVSDRDVAVHLWGRVFQNGKGVGALTIRLQPSSASAVEVKTDDHGRFRFENAFRTYRNQNCTLSVIEPWKLHDNVRWVGTADLSAATFPRIRIELPE